MLRIYLVGRVMIESPAGVLEPSAFRGRQGRIVFVYLASAPRRVERDELAAVVWPEQLPDAWDTALSAIVSKLRRPLARVGLTGPHGLESVHGCYELRLPEATWIDLRTAVNALDRAEGALRSGDAVTAWSNATVASAIVRRPFVPGDTGPWVDRMRRHLHDYEVRAFDTLAGAWLTRGSARSAVAAARRAVELAPYRESCYVRLMEAQLAAGDRAEALRVYNELRVLLRESLGISPAEEVEELYRRALG